MVATATKNAADRQAGFELGCDGWLTRDEAVAAFGLSARWFRRRIIAGEIRASKLGDWDGAPVRICRRSVHEYIKRHEGRGTRRRADR